MFCKNCGNEIEDGAKFCGKCGADFSDANFTIHESSYANTETQSDNTVNKKTKEKTRIISYIIAIAIVIGIICLLVTGAKWACSTIGSVFNKDNERGRQDTDTIGADTLTRTIEITDIKFNSSTCKISFEIKNVSEKDIAYIDFDTYLYDRMGNKVTYYYDDYALLSYTGPLYHGEETTASWEFLFGMPNSTAVVYPKNITVTFFDDTKITLNNDIYAYSDDFYGGELKD
ncbi:MAG: zinc-ribbon domain-containing protein [Ruminococcus sp.]